jgi:hypothetical protein
MEHTMHSFSRHAAIAILCIFLAPVTGFAQDKFFDSNGVRIRYVEQGNGDPIVLIHGFGVTHSLGKNFNSRHGSWESSFIRWRYGAPTISTKRSKTRPGRALALFSSLQTQ